jgi:hypothetical protein
MEENSEFFETAALRADAASSAVGGADFQTNLDPDGVTAAFKGFLATL